MGDLRTSEVRVKQDEEADMTSERVCVTLEEFDQRLMVNGLVEFKNDLQRQGRPTEDVENLIVKVIDVPPAREKRREREAR